MRIGFSWRRRREFGDLLSSKPNEVASALLAMDVREDESLDEVTDRVVQERLALIELLKERGLWTPRLQSLEDQVVRHSATRTDRQRELTRSFLTEVVKVARQHGMTA